jgi:hypothetical protein
MRCQRDVRASADCVRTHAFYVVQRLAILATTIALLMAMLVSECFVRLGRDILNEQ